MLGRQSGDQASLFYFRLDDRVPKNHLLRRINVVVTPALADMHERLQPYYSEIGRPSVDPELMMRMLIIGYCYGLRSERKLTQEVELHLAYRWFCWLDLDDKVPHHSTFSETRLHRFRESDVFRHIFERVVAACMAAGLVKGEGFAVDASVMEANASRYHGKAPDEIVWTEPERQTRAVKEYLAALEAENEPNPDRKPPKVISPSDPCSAWTAKANKRVQFGYGLNYLIDIENAVIVDVEATPARTYDEVAATRTMIERTDKRLGLRPKRLVADTAYGTGKFLGWLIDAGIAPHIPVRAAEIRNRALTKARGAYCIFIDGDCLAPPSFVATHRRLAERGWFVAGKRAFLSRQFTERVLRDDLEPESFGLPRWLAHARGDVNRVGILARLPLGALRRLASDKWKATQTCNLAAWRSDIDRINGFDARYVGWGLEDSDFVVRLLRDGVRRKSGRFAGAVVHLWHPQEDKRTPNARPYFKRRWRETEPGRSAGSPRQARA